MNTHPELIYHVYPLGACGAPRVQSPEDSVCYRLAELEAWAPFIRELQMDTVYLGPVWQSESHGYDTLDFYQVDQRLGDLQTLRNLVHAFHAAGLRVVLDGVFNHVGRGFFAFQDVLKHREHSKYRGWFAGLDFSRNNAYQDRLCYSDWSGCQNLVKLNGAHPEVKAYLLGAVSLWVNECGIDGLRLDAADDLHPDFIQSLRAHCDSLNPQFWLLGEMVHGDYNRLLGTEKLHSVTNYELYKSLYSSLNDMNFFELAYAVNRQYSPSQGIYRNHRLYSFADNHDVDRVASVLQHSEHLKLLYLLLATLPGRPSLYYGSEWGTQGRRGSSSDQELRPPLAISDFEKNASHPLRRYLQRLFSMRLEQRALREGVILSVKVDSKQYAFLRYEQEECVLVCVNATKESVHLRLDIPEPAPYEGLAEDILDGGPSIQYGARTLYIEMSACFGRVLRLKACG